MTTKYGALAAKLAPMMPTQEGDDIVRQTLSDASSCAQEPMSVKLRTNGKGGLALRRLSVGNPSESSLLSAANWYENSQIVIESRDRGNIAFHRDGGGASFIVGDDDEIAIGDDGGWGYSRVRLGQNVKVLANGQLIAEKAAIENLDVGALEARYMHADEFVVERFTTQFNQVINGQLTVCKVSAKLARDFICPAAAGTADMYVDELPDYTGNVFADGDFIRLALWARVGTGVTSTVAWGTVAFVSRDPGYTPARQKFTFTRSSGGNEGAMTTGSVVAAGSLVSDFGTSADSIIAVQGTGGVNAPYITFNRWASHPAASIRSLLIGNLRAATGVTEHGIYAGTGGLTSADTFVILSTAQFKMQNVPMALYNSGVQTFQLSASGLDFWLGPSSAAKKITFNGTTLSLATDVLIGTNAADTLTNKDELNKRVTTGVTGTFTPTSATAVSWAGVYVHYGNGTYVSVNDGSRTLSSSREYFYIRRDTSPSTMRFSGTPPTDTDAYLVAVCEQGATLASVNVVGGRTWISGDWINTGTITATNLKADAIDGKTITGATIQTTSSSDRIVLDPDGMRLIANSAPSLNDSSTIRWRNSADTSTLHEVGPEQRASFDYFVIKASTRAEVYFNTKLFFIKQSDGTALASMTDAGYFDASVGGIRTKTSAGAPTGGNAGDIQVDTTGEKIAVRIGTDWYYANLTKY